ncbi:MAG: PilZ domain-containing protein [Hydrogenoanaerobacterium sp.]
MTPLDSAYEGSSCRIESEKNELLATGTIYRIDDEGIDVIDSAGGKMMLIAYKTPVKISIFNSKLGFQLFRCTVFTSTQWSLRVSDVETIQDFERREFFRVSVRVKANLYTLTADKKLRVREEKNEENKDKEPSPEDIPLEIMVENISLNGLLFATSQIFQMNDVFEVELLLFKNILRFKCRICRMCESDTRLYRYGCQFFENSQRTDDNLCKDLFQLQRIELKKRRDNAFD